MKRDANYFRQKGCVFGLIGLILLIASITYLIYSLRDGGNHDFFLSACAFYLGFHLMIRGGKLMAPLADKALSKGSRAPNIYLRQFKTDKNFTRVPRGKSLCLRQKPVKVIQRTEL